MIKRNGVLYPCGADIDEPRKVGCRRHRTEYVASCAKCVDEIIPNKRFCNQHRDLEGHAMAKHAKRKDRYALNQRRSLRGQRRHHVREDSDVEVDNDEADEQNHVVAREAADEKKSDDVAHGLPTVPENWSFKVGRCWLYGYYMIVKTCGYILWASPLYRSEGCWQTVAIWNDCFRGQKKPNYTWTDQGCKLWRYINNKAMYSAVWSRTRWLVDRFHGNKSHNMTAAIETFCTRNCDVGNMAEARKRVAAPGISGRTNSQAQEQVMAKIGKLNWTFNMSHYMQWFTIFWITMDMNIDLVSKMRQDNVDFVPSLCLYR